MEYVVVKLGGSLISPGNTLLDQKYVRKSVEVIKSYFSSEQTEGKRLVLVTGGGSLSRTYRDLADACGEKSDIDRHRIGITATWLNAELIRSLLDEITFKRVLGVGVYAENRKEAERLMAKDFEHWLQSDIPMLIAGGFINGVSTDFNAVLLASKIGIERVYKLSDIDFVYSGDPKKGGDVRPIEDLSWAEYFRLFDVSLDNLEHAPGSHAPVDMIAAKLCSENEISCTLLDGRDPSILKSVLLGENVRGTLIHP